MTDLTRRRFLSKVCALSAASGLGVSRPSKAEPAPEVTRIRLVHTPAICLAPQYLAEDLLRVEGFTQIDYVNVDALDPSSAVRDGRADFTQDTAPAVLPKLDTGRSLIVLGGIHVGCYELFGNDRVRAVRDLKGKSIGVSTVGAAEYVFISSMLAYVGIDPTRDVKWIDAGSFDGPMKLFVEGKCDAFLGFAPQPQELRRQKVGRVIVDTSQDRPWAQYFCCVMVGSREFVAKYPIATKRVLRAFLKAADMCAREPERAARYLVERGFEPRYAVGLEVLKSLPYNRWRESDPEDTIRFHALRLHEVGMLKTNPQKLIAQGTDWRFLNELKKELKA